MLIFSMAFRNCFTPGLRFVLDLFVCWYCTVLSYRFLHRICETSSYICLFVQMISVEFTFLNHCSSRYIVYDVAQVNMKYLLKIKFNYQTSLW